MFCKVLLSNAVRFALPWFLLWFDLASLLQGEVLPQPSINPFLTESLKSRRANAVAPPDGEQPGNEPSKEGAVPRFMQLINRFSTK